MKFSLKPWQKIILLVLALIFIVATLIKPLVLSLATYIKYSRTTREDNYVNANLRKVENKIAFLGIFGSCYVEVQYDYVVKQEIYMGKDSLACEYKGKVTESNTIPVYYNPDNPSNSVSDFALATNGKQLLNNTILGILGVILIVAVLYISRHSRKKNPVDDYL